MNTITFFAYLTASTGVISSLCCLALILMSSCFNTEVLRDGSLPASDAFFFSFVTWLISTTVVPPFSSFLSSANESPLSVEFSLAFFSPPSGLACAGSGVAMVSIRSSSSPLTWALLVFVPASFCSASSFCLAA